MNINNPIQKGGDNLVLKRFPKEDSAESDIAIVDSRRCIRDAIAVSLRHKSKRRIHTADCADALANSTFSSTSTELQIILFCDGSLETEEVERELLGLRQHNVEAKIALLTDHSSSNQPSELLDGVIPSHYETNQLLACLQVIESGIKYTPTLTTGDDRAENPSSAPKWDKKAISLLTPRQRQVMKYISEGRSNKYIAAELSVSESTIKVHVHEAMRRLGATSRTHASFILNSND